MNKQIRAFVFWVALVLLGLSVAGCTASQASTSAEDIAGNTLSAARMNQAVTIDGKIAESDWQKAPVSSITLSAEPGVEPKEIRLRALFDKESIYLAAEYRDSTPLKIGEAWEYDGSSWKKGGYDDTLAFVWNMDDSIPGFNDRGLSVMTKGLKKGDDVFDFRLAVSDAKTSAAQADFWGWCGMPEFYGRGDDMIFKVDDTTAFAGMTKTLAVQHDAYLNSTPWIRNETKIDGVQAPKLKYKAGQNILDNPRPFEEDMDVVTDYSGFKAGDREPFVVGIKGAKWGGSKDDISTKGYWVGNVWTVEFMRRLDTGHKDDMKFIPGQPATFVIIIRDDSKGYAISKPVTLVLE